MREMTYYVAVSLDGYIAAPDDTFDAFPVQGDHIDWIIDEWTDTLPGIGLEMLGRTADNSRFDTVVMGWGTLATWMRRWLAEGGSSGSSAAPLPELSTAAAATSRSCSARLGWASPAWPRSSWRRCGKRRPCCTAVAWPTGRA